MAQVLAVDYMTIPRPELRPRHGYSGPLEYWMLPDVVAVKPSEDTVCGYGSTTGRRRGRCCGSLPFDGVFEALRDPQAFATVTLNRELGTLVWPNGADIDPVVLYENLSPTKRMKQFGHARVHTPVPPPQGSFLMPA